MHVNIFNENLFTKIRKTSISSTILCYSTSNIKHLVTMNFELKNLSSFLLCKCKFNSTDELKVSMTNTFISTLHQLN